MSRLKTALMAGGLLVPVLGAVLLVALPVGGYYAYRTYDYVQHDNDFCLSCHLMAGPYEAFARSDHRGLGCKACHRPTLVGRSQMALTQIVEQPEELSIHAEVPDEICAECHVQGDPEKWRNIAASAGHRVHLESPDSALQGLQCVTCHSTSIHEFTSTDQTCGQSECHADTDIQLGAMGDFTIHCVACHAFRAPVEGADREEVLAAIRPSSDECLSCHVMRTLVDLPTDEPHGGVCATCHNPHEQREAADAVQSCASAGCHDQPEQLTPLHRGLQEGALGDCMQCHQAHQFRLEGQDCRGCHTDPEALDGVMVPTSAATALHTSPLVAGAARVAASLGDTVMFRHVDHPDVDCISCHAVEESHGTVTLSGVDDCRSCHHTEQGGAEDCASCHAAEAPFRTAALTFPVGFDLSVGTPHEALASFSHEDHQSTACGTCHVDPPGLPVAGGACAGCHSEHHVAEADCASCHQEAPSAAHPVSAHVGCTGAGCHETNPVGGVPRTRAFCLSCHQELREHRTEDNCIACHPLPEPRQGS